MKYHYIRQEIGSNIVVVCFVPTVENKYDGKKKDCRKKFKGKIYIGWDVSRMRYASKGALSLQLRLV